MAVIEPPELHNEDASAQVVVSLSDDGAASEAGELLVTEDTSTPEEEPVVSSKVSHRTILFFVMASAMMMSAIDQTVVSTALPTLHRELHAPINWTGWTITTYQLGLVISLPVAGRLSDQFGRRKVFLVCLVFFGTSSLMCGLSRNIYMLIAFRAIQAIGGAGFVPSATGIITDHFGKNRDRAIGMFSSIVPIGSMAGPVFGGLIISGWSWRGVFLINVPICLTVFVLAIKYVPSYRPKDAPPADYLGTVYLVLTLLPVMFGITSLGSGHVELTSPNFYLPIVIGVFFGWVSVRHAKRIEVPLIPIHLLRIPSFAVMNIINFLFGGCVLGFAALVPLYAETRYGFTSLQAGTLLTGRAFGAILVAGITTLLLRRLGYRIPMLAGLGMAAIGLALLAFHPSALAIYAWLAICSTILGIGTGIAAPATNNALYQHAPKEVGSIAGVRGMFRQSGAIVSISIVTAIVTRSKHPGLVLGHTFFVYGLIVAIIAMPLVFAVPKHKGRW